MNRRKSETFRFRISNEDAVALRMAAASLDVSASELVRSAAVDMARGITQREQDCPACAARDRKVREAVKLLSE